MVSRRKFEILELYPQPKKIEQLEGMSELSNDIRLVTDNVFPLQRKEIRSILTASGVKVVANKKRYVVNSRVSSPKDFDLEGVPEAVQHDYYELKVHGSEVDIRTPYQEGMVWASQTLAGLFVRSQKGLTIPNLIIRDWPDLPIRGIFMENKWGPDRMSIGDWHQTIDTLSSMKMNTLGVSLYGCWGSCRFEGPSKPTEFLMVPVEGEDDLVAWHHLRWYSGVEGEWKEANYLPTLTQPNAFSEVINYGRERGVNVVPYVNSFGHNTFFPRMRPELSAKDADGNPTGVGYCITSSETRAFVEKFYTSIIERYFPHGIDYFHVQMDEVWTDYPWPDDPLKVGEPWCQCEKCRAHTKEKNLQDYVIWLVGMLVSKGVGKVVMWNDQMTRHMSAFDSKFVKRLEKAGLKDRLVIDWWWYSNKELNDTTRVRVGKKLGIDGWVTPMTCYFNWSTYDYRLLNVDMMLRMGAEEGGCGAVSYAVHDTSHLDHEALLAGLAWEGCGEKREQVMKRWSQLHFGDNANLYWQAQDLLLKAVGEPMYPICLNYQYTYVSTKVPWPRPYPGEALDRLMAQPEDVDVVARLQKCAEDAAAADALYVRLLETEGLDDLAVSCLKSLRGEVLRIQAVAKAFAWLVELRKGLANGMVKKSYATACQKVMEDYAELLKQIEVSKPVWVVPATLQALSRLLTFLQQLHGELQKYAARKKASALNWGLLEAGAAAEEEE